MSFTCPRCGMTSHNPNDAENRYCANCHEFISPMNQEPMYWMNETSGVLAPVIEKYLSGKPLSMADLGVLRAYFRQWVGSPVWDQNPHMKADGRKNLNELRGDIQKLTDREHVERWLARAVDLGMDPL